MPITHRLRDPLRVSIGPTDVAGTASALASGLRALGVGAEVVLSIAPFGAPSASVLGRRARVAHGLAAPLRRDVLHYQFGITWLPWHIDAFWARVCRRTLLVTYHGDDCRSHGVARVLFPARARYGAVTSDAHVRRRMERLRRACHAAFVADLELATYVAPFFSRVYVMPVPVRLEAERAPAPPRDAGRPLVVMHAPSDPVVKGTAAIVRAVENLARTHAVELRLVTEASRRDVLSELRGADIVIDQLNSVTPGVFALEAMGHGLPVLGEIDACALAPYQLDIPVVRVTPDTLESELETLVLDPARRLRLAERGRAFVARNHDPVQVAAMVLELYRHARIGEPGVYHATTEGIVPLATESWRELERRSRRLATIREEA